MRTTLTVLFQHLGLSLKKNISLNGYDSLSSDILLDMMYGIFTKIGQFFRKLCRKEKETYFAERGVCVPWEERYAMDLRRDKRCNVAAQCRADY